ncbi:MAG: FAD-binding and (Fe-S)-binding domain-containing protein, partial [Chitinophagaceae bacterium]
NSCGLHSMVWGNVRDHLLEVKAILSDGSEAIFRSENFVYQTANAFQNNIQQQIQQILINHQSLILASAPQSLVKRRNMGYALDALISVDSPPNKPNETNLCKLIAGSEGTLCFVTEAKLQLLPLPPKQTALVCIHATSVYEAMLANAIALEHQPLASELVDKFIMDFTIGHPTYEKNRSFIIGNPEAVLMVEFKNDSLSNLELQAKSLISHLQNQEIGFAYPVLYNEETQLAWDIRKAGLGLLRNLPGDAQPVNLIEDCAVAPKDLPEYVKDIQQLLNKYQVQAAYYAHAGAGELHIEPILNLKTKEGVFLFRQILAETVEIVKKYRGSISGEHGDGRLRGEFIKAAVGEEMYQLFKQVKAIFDPNNIFNKGKIVDTPPMDTHLRYAIEDKPIKQNDSVFNFSTTGTMLRLAEKCSGSGDCRKSHLSGGTMCPSFMATRNEKDTTRARANILRNFLSNPHDDYPLAHDEIKEVMDLCLSCKGCKTECPSSVDVAKMKAEFLHHYYQQKGVPLQAKMIANFSKQMKLASLMPSIYNFIVTNKYTKNIMDSVAGFHSQRSLPKLHAFTLEKWMRNKYKSPPKSYLKQVYIFIDEFTNYNDVTIGIKAVELLNKLGYEVKYVPHVESGRTYLSKGLLKEAQQLAKRNVAIFSKLITKNTPLVGIEPSAILTFRDEYIDLLNGDELLEAQQLAKNCFTIEEFLAAEFFSGRIKKEVFTTQKAKVAVHAHCYQKALSSQVHTKQILSMPINYEVTIIPSGCCGMAGSFGYEKNHFEVSNQIGELVLFPFVRENEATHIIAASG